MLKSGGLRCSVLFVYVIIVGCGRVGSTLAKTLEKQSCDVCVIDPSQQSLDAYLSEDFKGKKIVGLPYRVEDLERAGIQNADAFAAVSDDDNQNIISARIAKERFGVKNVVSRIYDMRRSEVYQRVGIPTVQTINWIVKQVLTKITPLNAHIEFSDNNNELCLVAIQPNENWLLKTVASVESNTNARVAFIERYEKSFIPNQETLLQENDVLHVFMESESIEQVKKILVGEDKGEQSK
jgi:trk system potassium uptake protein TrkA